MHRRYLTHTRTHTTQAAEICAPGILQLIPHPCGCAAPFHSRESTNAPDLSLQARSMAQDVAAAAAAASVPGIQALGVPQPTTPQQQ
eukprot:scaffold266919_cov14-Tisochrysis_lutea.AAC.1